MRNYPDEDESRPRSWLGFKEAGKRAYERGNYEEALNLYRTALQPEYECSLTSDRQIILSNIVACRLQMGGDAQASAALNDAKQCVGLNPRWAKGHVRLASAYSALGKSNDACNSLQTALRIDPGNRTAREMLVRELQRERAPPSNDTNSPPLSSPHGVHDDDDAPPPPAQNPGYVPPSNNNESTNQGTNGIQVDLDVDEGWSLQDSLRFYQTQIMDWYTSQSDEVRTAIKAGIVFVVIYVAFGGRFGLESAFRPSDSSSSRERPMQGNYGQGNAYEQYYRERNAWQSQSRDSRRGYYDDYSYGGGGGGGYGYSRGDGSSSYYGHSGSSWGSSLPSLAIFAGLAYLCHLGGINPFHALLMLNAVGRRRRRFGGGFYRGGGFRRRRGPGGFYW